jgi:hypothetical protein
MAKETKKPGKKTKAVGKREPNVEVVEVADTQIAEAVIWINEKIKEGIHGTYRQIGSYVFDNFFSGDLEQVKSFNPHKASSFRKLTDRAGADLMISKTNLYRAVHVFIQDKLLLPTVPAMEQLTFSHKALLLPLKSDKKKGELANKVTENNLSTRDLQDLVKKAKDKEEKSAAGRPVLPDFLKSVTKSFSVFNKDGSLDGLNDEIINGLGKDELTELDEKLKLLVSSINQIQEALSHALANPAPVEPE